jgi:hypothetical protein
VQAQGQVFSRPSGNTLARQSQHASQDQPHDQGIVSKSRENITLQQGMGSSGHPATGTMQSAPLMKQALGPKRSMWAMRQKQVANHGHSNQQAATESQLSAGVMPH